MNLKICLVVAPLILKYAASRGVVPCDTGDAAIPLGTLHAASAVNKSCASDDRCEPVEQLDGSAPLCPEDFSACGEVCISPDQACCDEGAYSCPEGNVCAPPPLACAEREPNTLLTPGDQERPTTAADVTLPGLSETAMTTENAKLTASGSAVSPSDTATHVESSGPLETSTVVTTSDTAASSTSSSSPTESDPAEGMGALVRPMAWALAVPAVVVYFFS